MKSQLEVRDITLLYKINGHVPAYLGSKTGQTSDAHSYSTRHNDQLQSPFCTTATAQHSFFYCSTNILNSLCLNSRNSESLCKVELFSII